MESTGQSVGYSGTPLIQKLGIKPGHRVAFIHRPTSFSAALGPLPADARILTARATSLDVIVLFVKAERDLRAEFPLQAARLTAAGMLWIGWPKRAAGLKTDLSENVVRDIGLAAGLVDVKECAIDATWSGLKFVRRLKDR